MTDTSARRSAGAYGYSESRVGVPTTAQSAAAVVPLLYDLFHPRCVVDVGCGTGDWLAEFLSCGTEVVQGFDNDWIPRPSLAIPSENFVGIDLFSELPDLGSPDMVLCLEVAEHLPREAALRLLDRVCSSSRVVVWSAAVPGQGGHEHINEHPQSYWVERFSERGFDCFDLLRAKFWSDERVSWWYRQNCLVYATPEAAHRAGLHRQPMVADLIHPKAFEWARDPRNYSLRTILRHLPHYLLRRFGPNRP